MVGKAWDEKLIERLKDLRSEGLSCSAIATALGNGITRNSVIGKLNRMGMAAIRPDRPKIAIKARSKSPKKAMRVAFDVTTIPAPIVRAESLQLGLLDLVPGQCRYPTTTDSPYLFCGQAQRSDSSYCLFHHHVTHNRLEPLRRSKERKPPTFQRSEEAA